MAGIYICTYIYHLSYHYILAHYSVPVVYVPFTVCLYTFIQYKSTYLKVHMLHAAYVLKCAYNMCLIWYIHTDEYARPIYGGYVHFCFRLMRWPEKIQKRAEMQSDIHSPCVQMAYPDLLVCVCFCVYVRI